MGDSAQPVALKQELGNPSPSPFLYFYFILFFSEKLFTKTCLNLVKTLVHENCENSFGVGMEEEVQEGREIER